MSLSVGPTRDIAACRALRRAAVIEEQAVPEAVEQDGRDGQGVPPHRAMGRLP